MKKVYVREELEAMKVAELKGIAGELNISATGLKKAELIEEIVKHSAEEVPADAELVETKEVENQVSGEETIETKESDETKAEDNKAEGKIQKLTKEQLEAKKAEQGAKNSKKDNKKAKKDEEQATKEPETDKEDNTAGAEECEYESKDELKEALSDMPTEDIQAYADELGIEYKVIQHAGIHRMRLCMAVTEHFFPTPAGQRGRGSSNRSTTGSAKSDWNVFSLDQLTAKADELQLKRTKSDNESICRMWTIYALKKANIDPKELAVELGLAQAEETVEEGTENK